MVNFILKKIFVYYVINKLLDMLNRFFLGNVKKVNFFIEIWRENKNDL